MSEFFKSITDFIFMEDEISKSDVILIPGGSHLELIEKAAERFHQGMAPYILPSGGENNKLEDYETEWAFLFEKAVELGVPQEAILKENKASNTLENAIFSKQVLLDNQIEIKKIILVCKNFHSRRAFLTYASQFPKDCKILVAPVIDGKRIRKEDWFIDEMKRKKVLKEVEKIGIYFEHWMKDYNE